jgi:hypothetical protein
VGSYNFISHATAAFAAAARNKKKGMIARVEISSEQGAGEGNFGRGNVGRHLQDFLQVQ